MKLKQYLKGRDRRQFATDIGTTKNYINLLVCGYRTPSPSLALKIEQATGGAVTLRELLFPEKEKNNSSRNTS